MCAGEAGPSGGAGADWMRNAAVAAVAAAAAEVDTLSSSFCKTKTQQHSKKQRKTRSLVRESQKCLPKEKNPAV